MQFEQFVATRKWSDDVENDLSGDVDLYTEDGLPVKGWIYCDDLYITQTASGSYNLVVERDVYDTADLEMLEHKLYEWAAGEGFFEEKS